MMRTVESRVHLESGSRSRSSSQLARSSRSAEIRSGEGCWVLVDLGDLLVAWWAWVDRFYIVQRGLLFIVFLLIQFDIRFIRGTNCSI